MALPMVHLLAAWQFAKDKPELRENPDYYLGAISPDAIHIRDGNDKSHKNEVHFNNWRMPHPESVIQYWLNHNTAFDIGYGIHVLLDGQWATDFRRSFPQMLQPDGRPDPEIYYNDTVITDFELHASSPLTPFFWDMMRRGKAPKDHPMLRAREFELWRGDTLNFYNRPCPMGDPVRYINQEYIQSFLRRCQKMMNMTYERMLQMNDTIRSIMERRSNRGFSDEKLTDVELQTLVDVALAAPTACNYQDWHFIFVTNREIMDAFSADYLPHLLAKSDPQEREAYARYDVLFHAPLFVIITLPENPRSRFAQVDAGIAVENLAIAAQGMGLGSVIVGRPLEVFNSEQGARWEERFGFPAGHKFAIGIVIGHPAATKQAHPVGEGKVHFVE